MKNNGKKRFRTDMYRKACGWQNVYGLLLKEMDASAVDAVFQKASGLYDAFKKQHSACKGIRRIHVMSAIAEGSLYLPLRDAVGKERAVALLTEAAKPQSIAKHDRVGRMPAPLFMKVVNVISNVMFGEKAGFQRKWKSNTPTEKRYDLLTCPYVEILGEMGCPEACGAICVQDVYSFSALKNGVDFERTQTLGTGGNCCDFAYVFPKGQDGRKAER